MSLTQIFKPSASSLKYTKCHANVFLPIFSAHNQWISNAHHAQVLNIERKTVERAKNARPSPTLQKRARRCVPGINFWLRSLRLPRQRRRRRGGEQKEPPELRPEGGSCYRLHFPKKRSFSPHPSSLSLLEWEWAKDAGWSPNRAKISHGINFHSGKFGRKCINCIIGGQLFQAQAKAATIICLEKKSISRFLHI